MVLLQLQDLLPSIDETIGDNDRRRCRAVDSPDLLSVVLLLTEERIEDRLSLFRDIFELFRRSNDDKSERCECLPKVPLLADDRRVRIAPEILLRLERRGIAMRWLWCVIALIRNGRLLCRLPVFFENIFDIRTRPLWGIRN